MSNRKMSRGARRMITLVATLVLVTGLVPVGAFATVDDQAAQGEPIVSDQTEGMPQGEETGDDEGIAADSQDVCRDDPAAAERQDGNSEPMLLAQDVRDVYIDNTEDKSVSYVTGVIITTNEATGETTSETVYSESASVTYSNPKTAQVQGMINDAYTAVYTQAEATGYEFEMSTGESTGRVWDNRTYTTVEDGDAVLIGDSDYLHGAYGANDDYVRTHIASGDYGKETFYRVEAHVTIPADTHNWGEPAYAWLDDNSTVTATRVCADDASHVEAETANTTSEVTKAATCTAKGETTYTATFTNTAFVTQTKTVEDVAIDANAHDWDAGTIITNPTCTEQGTKTFTCKNDGSHTKTEAVSALGHDWSAWEVTKEATEAEDGEEMRNCSRCDETETRAIPRLVVEYRNTEGDGATWTQGSDEALTFVFKRNIDDGAAFGHFTGILVDGAEVDASSYSAEAGSVVVTLPASYLGTLSAGNHTITAAFDDGDDASADFIIEAADSSSNPSASNDSPTSSSALPTTGDPISSIVPVLVSMMVGGALLLVLGVFASPRRCKEKQVRR